MDTRTAATTAMNALREAGFEAYLVGGCVRDVILGRAPKDFDITTNATPEQVIPLFEKTIPVGAKFGVVIAMVEDIQFEIATYRSDGAYTDGRRPDEVSYSKRVEDDVTRRDFTMNGLIAIPYDYENPPVVPVIEPTLWNNGMGGGTYAIIDYVSGFQDIKNKTIRCIGDPNKRFKEDALRMLRAVRFAAQLGFTIEDGTYDAIVANVGLIRNVSRERVREELEKLVAAPYPTKGLVPLVATGLFNAIFEGDFAKDLRFQRTLMRFSFFGRQTGPRLGMAMLVVDCPNNVAVGEMLESLKFSTDDHEAILGAVVNDISDLVGAEDALVKLRARRPGVLELGLELCEQTNYLFEHKAELTTLIGRFASLKPEEINPVPIVTGRDLIAMGFTPGPVFATVLKDVEYHQLNGDFETTAQALDYAKMKMESMNNGK